MHFCDGSQTAYLWHICGLFLSEQLAESDQILTSHSTAISITLISFGQNSTTFQSFDLSQSLCTAVSLARWVNRVVYMVNKVVYIVNKHCLYGKQWIYEWPEQTTGPSMERLLLSYQRAHPAAIGQ